jgi:hypothetical protein
MCGSRSKTSSGVSMRKEIVFIVFSVLVYFLFATIEVVIAVNTPDWIIGVIILLGFTLLYFYVQVKIWRKIVRIINERKSADDQQ